MTISILSINHFFIFVVVAAVATTHDLNVSELYTTICSSTSSATNSMHMKSNMLHAVVTDEIIVSCTLHTAQCNLAAIKWQKYMVK